MERKIKRMRALAVILVLTVAGSAEGKLPPNVAKTAQAAKAASQSPRSKKKPPAPLRDAEKQLAAQPQPTPAQPVVQLRPSQLPSVSPRVSYQGGKLTVVAENSTFADIIAAIRTATGIRIETQGGTSGDRVAAKIGPATPREVLLSLLQGSRFDYVMLGAQNDPEQIDRVILTPRMAGGPVVAPPSQAVAQPPPQPQNSDDTDENGDDDPGPPPVRGPDPQPLQPQPPQQQPSPQQPPQGVAPPQTQPGQNPSEVKTPEQLLEDLRRIEEQRRQQQQQQQSEPPRPR